MTPIKAAIAADRGNGLTLSGRPVSDPSAAYCPEQRVPNAKDKQRRTEPQRPGPAQVGSPSPVAVRHVLRYRPQDQNIEKRRQSQPEHPVLQKTTRPLLIISPRHKIPRGKEQEPHKEGLQESLICHKAGQLQLAQLRRLLMIPAAITTVGHGRMHAQHEHNHHPAEIIDKDQADGPRSGSRRLNTGKRSGHHRSQNGGREVRVHGELFDGLKLPARLDVPNFL